MSRIRSIHPGLWTDERFVSVTPLARLLFMGIWNECDDQGVFEWSPLKLKMRLLPADNADAAELLTELETAGSLLRFTEGTRTFGVVRSFARFQRPKKPNAVYPCPPLASSFAAGSSEAVPNQFPTDGEIRPQMEEGGGRREEVSSVANATGAVAPAGPTAIDLKKAVFDSGVPLLKSTGSTERSARSMIGRWIGEHGEGRVLSVLALATANPPADPIPWIRTRLESANGQPRLSGNRGSLSSWIDEPEEVHSGPH